jgi:hypothetical protein
MKHVNTRKFKAVGAFFKAFGFVAPRTLPLIFSVLSIFLAVACEKELTHYPEIVAYHAESKTLDVATSDSIGKFNVKVKTFGPHRARHDVTLQCLLFVF